MKLCNNVFFACHIAGVFDVNRNNVLKHDDYDLVKVWANSIRDLNQQGIIFNNNFSDKTVAKYQSENIIFNSVQHDSRFSPNVFRYFVYRDFLSQHSEIENLFLTDVSDVIVIQNPFIQELFFQNPDKLFCGDEPKQLNNNWMNEHSNHLRSKISNYANYEKKFANEILLNCGIIGGSRKIMSEFLNKLCAIHENYNYDNETSYTGDMGAFNFLVRTEFKTRVIHGEPVNTVFKEYQDLRTDCWLRHK